MSKKRASESKTHQCRDQGGAAARAPAQHPQHASATGGDEAHAAYRARTDPRGSAETAGAFPHERLDAYRVALEVAAVSKAVAKRIPRGHRSIADHLQRSASNIVLLLAEGANRRTAAEKRQRFVESRGECAEVAAAADLVIVLDLDSGTQPRELKHLAARVSAMLTGLIGRHH